MLPYTTPPKGGGVYVIWLSDTHYYGGRCRSFAVRWKTHLYTLQRGTHHNRQMQTFYNQQLQFRPEVVEELPPCMQEEGEQRWLDAHWGKPGCLNVSRLSVGANGGLALSDEHRARIGAANAKALKGRTLSPAHRKAIAEGNRGNTRAPHTATTKEKLRAALKNRALTVETRTAMSNARRGVGKSSVHSFHIAQAQRVRHALRKGLEVDVFTLFGGW